MQQQSLQAQREAVESEMCWGLNVRTERWSGSGRPQAPLPASPALLSPGSGRSKFPEGQGCTHEPVHSLGQNGP